MVGKVCCFGDVEIDDGFMSPNGASYVKFDTQSDRAPIVHNDGNDGQNSQSKLPEVSMESVIKWNPCYVRHDATIIISLHHVINPYYVSRFNRLVYNVHVYNHLQYKSLHIITTSECVTLQQRVGWECVGNLQRNDVA